MKISKKKRAEDLRRICLIKSESKENLGDFYLKNNFKIGDTIYYDLNGVRNYFKIKNEYYSTALKSHVVEVNQGVKL